MSVLDSGLETIDYRTPGWDAILTKNIELLDAFFVGSRFLCGFKVRWGSDNEIEIGMGSGKCGSTTKILFLEAPITISLITDLDEGSEQSNTWYYPWLFGNEITGEVVGKFSASYDDPVLPEGFTLKRRVGSVRNNNASTLLKINQSMRTTSRIVRYLEDIAATRVMGGGAAPNWTQINISEFVPPTAELVYVRLANDSASGNVLISSNGIDTHDYVYQKDSRHVFMAHDAQKIYYKVQSGGIAYIEILGYLEEL